MASDFLKRPQSERQAELLARFSYAEAARTPYEQRAIEGYKLYNGHMDPLPEEKQGRSNLFIPRTYEQIDTLRSRIMKSLLSSRPYIDFIPKPTQLELVDSEVLKKRDLNAQIAAALVDTQLESNKYPSLLYDYSTSLLIFPAAILGVGWRYEKRKLKTRVPKTVTVQDPITGQVIGQSTEMVTEMQERVLYDGNQIVNIDFFDFWPDPRGYNLDSCRFVWHREWLTQEQLENRLALLEKAINEEQGEKSGELYDFDVERARGFEGEEGRWQRMVEVDLAPESDQGSWAKEEAKGGYLFEILHYWEDYRHAIIVNREQLVYDGVNPYYMHHSKPFVVASYEPLPNEFYGRSAVEFMKHLQHELNTHRNQRIDNVSFVLNKMWMKRRDADIDESQLVSRPFGIIEVDDIERDLKEMTMNDVTSSSYNEEVILKQDMENVLGVPAVVRGADTTKRETATEVVTKTGNASIRFDTKIMLFDSLAIRELARKMDLNNQQFIEEARLVKVFGSGAFYEWQQASPEDIMGEFEYRAACSGVDPSANREIRRQQLNELMSAVMAMQIPFADKRELFKEWLSSYDLRNPQKFLLAEEEVMQQMLAFYNMLQQGQQGQAPAPAPAQPQTAGGTPQITSPPFQ